MTSVGAVDHDAPARGGAVGAVGAGAVLRDLVDAVVAEGLAVVEPPADPPGWGRLGPVHLRLRAGSATTPWRADGGEVRDGAGRALGPDDVLVALGLAGTSGADDVVGDLRAAAGQSAALAAAWARLPAEARRPEHPLAGERLTALRGRPFHPTARAVSGWGGDEVAALGPMRADPLPLRWVAVRRDHLRLGPAAGSARLHDRVLGDPEPLEAALAAAGLDVGTHQPLPVHPWQARHVLPEAFAAEIAAGLVVPLDGRGGDELGGGAPTASLRTLVLRPGTHLKLPLGVATLGAARLLPPRYLDNADRAEAVMRTLLAGPAADPLLAGRVAVCAEGMWAGWARPDGSDEFADRPGHLAAQIRTLPDGDGTLLPLGALAADAWEVLGPAFGVGDPAAFLAALAEDFAVVGLAFLRHGVLPELHGQNVLVRLGVGGRVAGWVLRDHDTLRVVDGRRDVPDPAYRIRPGARQSLRLDDAAQLLGYLQTLGLQVAVGGVVDALARATGVPEATLWGAVREGVAAALARVGGLDPGVRPALLDAPRWPLRTVLGPLLATGRASGVSMPAGTGSAANPLRDDVTSLASSASDAASLALDARKAPSIGPRERSRAAHRARLVNAFLRETTPPTRRTGDRLAIELPATGRALALGLAAWSCSGHHAWGDAIELDGAPAGHDDLVAAILAELAAVAPGADVDGLAAHIGDSVDRAARYLGHGSPAGGDPVRAAEQSVRLGHPFHPTPKSAEGFTDADLARYAPELGAAFPLVCWAVARELLVEERVGAGPWLPDDVTVPDGFAALPLHPFQDARLRADPAVRGLVERGAVVPLGPRGPAVYPTSSTRTVCDPAFPTAWKLPLHVRLTHFVRTTPTEHARRAADASRAVAALRGRWEHPGFGVVVETGYRGLAPEAVGAALAAETIVTFREQPGGGHRVLAGLVEEPPGGGEPPLVGEVRASGLDPRDWLRAYLGISLLPLLAVFAADGVGFEAHPQNALLATDGGRPVGFRVRDMEGAHLSRDRLPGVRRPGLVDPASPAVYDEDEAWRRLRYHAVVNGLGLVVATLGRATGDEPGLWRVVADALRDGPAPYADALRTDATLPAKANLLSRLGARGETPLFVDVPNPIREHR